MSSIKFHRLWVGTSALLLAIAACSNAADPKDDSSAGGDPDSSGATSGNSGTAGKKSSDAGGARGETAGENAGGTESSSGGAAQGGAANGGAENGGSAGADEGGAQDAGTGNGPPEGGAGGDGGVGDNSVGGDTGRGHTGPLVLQVTAAQSPAIVGQDLLYTITIGNTANVSVKDVNLLFRVPKGLSFYYTGAVPASSACGNGYCTENEEATWSLGDIPAGAVRTIQFAPAVLDDVGDGDALAPQIRLSAKDLDSLTLSPSIPVAANAPAELTLSANADPVVAGDELELSVDVGQIGEAALFTGELQLDLPGWLEVTSISDGGSDVGDQQPTIAWDIASLPVGSSFRRLIKAKVRAGASAGQVLNPRARLSYEDAEIDNVAQLQIGVVSKATPLLLQIDAAADPVVPGGGGMYLVTVSNPSLRAVDGITLTERVPGDESFYYTSVEPDSSGCGNGYCSGDELAIWTLGTLQAGQSETITVPFDVVQQVAGDGSLVASTFQLDAVGMNSLHRFKTIAAHAKPSAQLVLGTVFSPATPGQTFTYDLDVGQIGLGSLQDSVLTLELPPEVSAGTPSNSGTVTDGVVSWSLGAVAVAATAHCSIAVTVGSETPAASILNARATLSFENGQERDAVSEFALPLVAETLPLQVTLTETPSPIVLGNTLSYTTTIKNTAERTIDDVSLLLRMPMGYSYYYTTGADPDSSGCGNGYCADGEEATWSLGSIAAGATKIVNVNPTAASTLTGGSLATFRQRLTAVDSGGTIMLQTTLPTKK